VAFLKFLKSCHDRLLELVPSIRFDKKHQAQFARIALYASLIEFTGAIISMIENRGRVAIPSAFRSFLEAAVELKNLSADQRYIEHMYASHMDQWLRVLKEARGKNPYLAGIGGLPELDQLIKKDEQALEALVAKGKRPLNVYDRFERAGMLAEYRSLYNFLSCDAHSNVRALVTRHFEETEGDFDVVMYKDAPLESFDATLDSIAAFLLEASTEIHKAFDTKQEAAIEAIVQELEAVRKKCDAQRLAGAHVVDRVPSTPSGARGA
jgi:hypothetical protein